MKYAVVLFLVFAAAACWAAEPISQESADRLIGTVATGKALFFNTEPAFGELPAAPELVGGKAALIRPGSGEAVCPPGANACAVTFISTGGYAVHLCPLREGRLLKMRMLLRRVDGKPFKTISYGVAIDTDAYPCFKDAGFFHEGKQRTSGSRQPPMVAILDNQESCLALLGFMDQIEVAELKQDGSSLRMSRPASWESITATEIKDGIYLDLSGDYWFDALKGYAKNADEYRGYKPRPIPPQAYEPVWCSWYTLTTGVNEQNIWENAVIARELGFGTILIDAGWDTPGDVCMKEDSTYGDRIAYSRKFPNMAALVDRIHKELGMAVELWAAPWAVGKKSRAEREIADSRVRVGKNQVPGFFLCARCEKSGDFLAKNIADVFRYYHIDGMWWDFIDSVTMVDCRGHKHDYDTYGQGYQAGMTKIVDAVREVKPDALIEIRLNSANINNKLFANVLETNDTPLYFDDNRDLLVYVRTLVDGCVPKTDPTMWQRSKEEGLKIASDELAGRFMATMVSVGVPAVSQDFTKMSESNKRVVKAYLDFYHTHKQDLIDAELRPIGSANKHPHFFSVGRRATYVYSATPEMPAFALKSSPRMVCFFNASDKPGVQVEIKGLRPGVYTWQARNHFLEPGEKGTVEVRSEGLTWTAPVPTGGMLELTPGR